MSQINLGYIGRILYNHSGWDVGDYTSDAGWANFGAFSFTLNGKRGSMPVYSNQMMSAEFTRTIFPIKINPLDGTKAPVITVDGYGVAAKSFIANYDSATYNIDVNPEYSGFIEGTTPIKKFFHRDN